MSILYEIRDRTDELGAFTASTEVSHLPEFFPGRPNQWVPFYNQQTCAGRHFFQVGALMAREDGKFFRIELLLRVYGTPNQARERATKLAEFLNR